MAIWKDVPGYEGLYSVSDDGKIKSHARTAIIVNRWGATVHRPVEEKLVALSRDKYGYLKAKLSKGGVVKFRTVHRIVAEAFISNPNVKPEVNHINGVKSDNRVSNLEWATAQENQQHSRTVLGNFVAEKNPTVKLTKADAIAISELCASGMKNVDIAARFNCERSTVSNIRNGKHWAIRKRAA
jgi:NUMOD4 motif/HNH endonuclease